MDEQILRKKTLAELRKMLEEKGLSVPSGTRKQPLIDLLIANEATTTVPQQEETVAPAISAVAETAEVRVAESAQVEEPARENRRALSTQQRMGARTQPVQTFRGASDAQQSRQPARFNAETQMRRIVQTPRRPTNDPENTARTARTAERSETINVQRRQRDMVVGQEGTPVRNTVQSRPANPSIVGSEVKNSTPQSGNVRENRVPSEYGDGAGILEIHPDGYGFLRADNYLPGNRDLYVSAAQIRRFNLRTGDYVKGKTRGQQAENQSDGLIFITEVNGDDPERAKYRKPFDSLIPVYPDERLRLERADDNDPSLRLVDIIAPIGKGQRGMIVSQPKAGKTTLLKKIANAITANNPEVHLIVLLIDERPEEVTDMRRSISGEVIYSTFDEAPENHTRVSEMVLERAQRLVEQKKDVVILLDSITRLARAYNLVIPPTGRSLSGGLDPGALYRPKRFFGAARNIENGGSLTIIATALVDTGSRMDDIIFEEFKGTGNMELHLDRSLSERRIFPAIDVFKSGTRREDLLLSKEELEGTYQTRRMLSAGNPQETFEQLISYILKTPNNAECLKRICGMTRAMEKGGFRMK